MAGARGAAAPPASCPKASPAGAADRGLCFGAASASAHSLVTNQLISSQLHRLLDPVVPSCALLRDLSPEEVAQVAGMMKLRAFRADEQLCAAGDPAHFFAVVLTGQLKAAIPHGERWPGRGGSAAQPPRLQEWRLLQPGEVFGEVALVSGLVRTAPVWAISPGWLGTVRYAALDAAPAALASQVLLNQG